jgi:signal transduction histidine kinase
VSELLGLRGRLTLALLAASALTLVITSVLLLLPLDRKLHQDVRDSVIATARAARPGLIGLPVSELHAGSARLRTAANELHRRTRLDIAFFDAGGQRLVATDADHDDRYPEIAEALRTGRVASRLGHGDEQSQAQVALPVSSHGTRFAVSFRKSLEDLSGAQHVVRRSLLAAALVALGVALVTGIALAARLVRRVTALRDAALAVAERGPGSAIVEDAGRDEIGDLSRAFATMQHRLDAQEQARRTFVSTASHELRTPLASLRLMLHGADEELAAADPDVGDARREIDKALRQTIRLGKLADELLDLSRLDAGVELRSEPVELVGLTRSVLGEFDHGGPVAQLDTGGPVWASVDPGAVARILRILIDNGLRHGELRIGISGGPPQVRVHDTGPGVPPADAERIFGRFERGEDTGEEGGFGLGLAIGRELAEKMGGTLRLERQGPGATFVAAFPAHDEAA